MPSTPTPRKPLTPFQAAPRLDDTASPAAAPSPLPRAHDAGDGLPRPATGAPASGQASRPGAGRAVTVTVTATSRP